VTNLSSLDTTVQVPETGTIVGLTKVYLYFGTSSLMLFVYQAPKPVSGHVSATPYIVACEKSSSQKHYLLH
jgi:hypothetical protein